MKIKIILIIVAVVAMVQILTYAYIVRGTVDDIQVSNQSLSTEIRSTEAQKEQLRRDIDRLEAMVQAIPPEFMARFNDPEAGYMEFLNFINDPIMHQMDISTNVRRAPTFTTQPIPHHESQFSFSFSFIDTKEAERFFNFLLHQDNFPLKLTTLTLRGSGSQEVNADVSISLHIPALHAQTMAVAQREK